MASEKTETKVIIIRRVFDTLLWLSALLFCLVSFSGVLVPPKTGFYCSDKHIRMPFTGDSINAAYLFAGCIFAPVILFLSTEAFHYHLLWKAERRLLLQRWSLHCGDYLLGLLYVLTVTEVGKALIGELRPHFLDSCRPEWMRINCSEGLISEYTCTTELPKYARADMYKSFPSGHASASVYCCIFCCIYIQARVPRSRYSHLFRSWIQLIFLLWACVCSLTRITDNRHHWWDVLSGVVLGVFGGFYVTMCVVQNGFLPPKEEDPEPSPSSVTTGNKHMTNL